MRATKPGVPALPSVPSCAERLDLAGWLYREFHARCFWHSPPDLIVTEDLIPFIINGLRKHGGRRGFILSRELRLSGASPEASAGELPECP